MKRLWDGAINSIQITLLLIVLAIYLIPQVIGIIWPWKRK